MKLRNHVGAGPPGALPQPEKHRGKSSLPKGSALCLGDKNTNCPLPQCDPVLADNSLKLTYQRGESPLPPKGDALACVAAALPGLTQEGLSAAWLPPDPHTLPRGPQASPGKFLKPASDSACSLGGSPLPAPA